jgi:chromosome partitioning protein
MPLIVSFVSQKGGVGKSAEGTAVEWAKLRARRALKPAVSVRRFGSADDAIIAGGTFDVLVIDGPARASAGTLELARQSDLVVQPSGCGLDDLRPAVLLFHELLAAGIGRSRLVVALSRTAGEAEEGAARRYVQKATYDVLGASVPERVTYREAMNEGASLVETSDKNLNDRARAVVDELVKKMRVAAAARAKRRKEQAG